MTKTKTKTEKKSVAKQKEKKKKKTPPFLSLLSFFSQLHRQEKVTTYAPRSKKAEAMEYLQRKKGEQVSFSFISFHFLVVVARRFFFSSSSLPAPFLSLSDETNPRFSLTNENNQHSSSDRCGQGKEDMRSCRCFGESGRESRRQKR